MNIGGGITQPMSSTANYAGLSGSFQGGAGYNVTEHHSFVGEFM